MAFVGANCRDARYRTGEPDDPASCYNQDYERSPWTRYIHQIWRICTNRLTHSTAKRDGKEWYEPGPHSDEMRALSKKFGMLHGVSSLLNLATFVSALAYGFTLGSRLQSVVDKI